jgi:hypothetical protein
MDQKLIMGLNHMGLLAFHFGLCKSKIEQLVDTLSLALVE